MRALTAPLLVALLVVAGCGASAGGRTLDVYAAASLTEVFGTLEKRFEQNHPGVDVRLNLAGSSKLAQQITEGAPADVFASADEPTMERVVEAGAVDGQPETFATNRLTIAVAPGNPLGIRGFGDLARPGVSVVVCAPQVPCGAATGKLERLTGVTVRPVSEEQDVKAVLTKVRAGEADAGLVYATDVASARGKVAGVRVPEAGQALNRYPVAALADADEPGLAREFRDLVLGEAGRRELSRAGFGAP
ncbi:molybdate ABC transporter substrate-binding protein [Prauserella oleivorans]|uniref:Molybdate ABC transporter substrate-binding protein n=1 Tax=Prauserella oleivorans TaxID=1478153 RepID=A0ABW5WD18_9PSEU